MRYTESFLSFAPHTHNLYILRYSINIVFITAEKVILIYILIQKIELYNYPLIPPFNIFFQQEFN